MSTFKDKRRPVADPGSLLSKKEHNDVGPVSKGKAPKKTKAHRKREQSWKKEWYNPERHHPYALAGASSFVERDNAKRSIKTKKKNG